jgi:hypothetical protein
MDSEPTFDERLDDWCAGRDWRWRAALLALLSWQAMRPLRDDESFHLFRGITFGAHEFGHLFFSFGGEWMTIAGGSLVLVCGPRGAGGALRATARDWFGAAACGTWLSASLGDLAPYIADARAMQMDLVSFSPDGGEHDWNYLLAHAGMLHADLALARFVRFLSVMVLLVSVLFSISLFVRMVRNPEARGSDASRV